MSCGQWLWLAQLVERSLPIPEVRSSIPVIGENLYWTFTVSSIEKPKRKEKEVGLDPTFKTNKLSWKFSDWKVPPDELEETASSFVLRKRRRPHLQRPRKASLLTLAYVVYSVTRSELLGNKFSYKSSPNIWVNVWFIIQLSFKTLFGYNLGNIWRNWGTFYFIINISHRLNTIA